MHTTRLLVGLLLFSLSAHRAFAADVSTSALSETPESTAYGLTQANPIKVGGFKQVGSRKVYQYISQLTGPNGEAISFQRQGSCCPFETKNTPFSEVSTTGLLDIFWIKYEGIQAPVKLYINSYDFEMPKAPAGFKLKSSVDKK